MKRVVLDTNVTISAFFWKGHPRVVYDLVRDKKLIMLLSRDMEKELIRVLGYSRFGLTAKDILPLVKNLRNHAKFAETTGRISVVTVDPTDNIFIECAVDGKADYILSGDKHLLDLEMYEGIQIIRAKDFLLKEGFIKDI